MIHWKRWISLIPSDHSIQMQKNTLSSQLQMEHSPGKTTSWVTNQTSVNIRIEPVLCNGRSLRNEKPVHRKPSVAPLAASREKPTGQQRRSTAKKKETEGPKNPGSMCESPAQDIGNTEC